MRTRAAAVAHPKGDITLHLCPACGFIYNAAFDPRGQEFSERYEETQGFSPTFRTFHERLAADLIDRWNLRGKRILEIGCGKGEFLALLCQLGDNEGLGFDPAFVPERNPAGDHVRVRYERMLYPPPPGTVRGWESPDFICCKMTLEHIREVGEFVLTLRHELRNAPEAVAFLQVPDAGRILGEAAFWDVYYEHCSYFTRSSLARLMRRAGFLPLDVWTDYGDQYLMIAASPTGAYRGPEDSAAGGGAVGPGRPAGEAEEGAEALGAGPGVSTAASSFSPRVAAQVKAWNERIATATSGGRPAVIWGGGSKAVAFLSALDSASRPQLVVDINPHKQGTFLPGTGLEILPPSHLVDDQPSLVIVMNPLYVDEIRAELGRLGIESPIQALGRG